MEQLTADDEDTVVEELDVFLSKSLQENLHLFQYPVRPSNISYDNSIIGAKIKPQQKQIQLEVAMKTDSPYYDESKGENISSNLESSSAGRNYRYTTGKMDKQMLNSSIAILPKSRYVIGVLKPGELHLSVIDSVMQLRPSFSYLDTTSVGRRSNAANTAGDGDEASSQDEEETKPVMMTFAKHETDEDKARRLASYAHLKRQQDGENWVKVSYIPWDDSFAQRERKFLFAKEKSAPMEFRFEPSEYLQKLVLPSGEAKQHSVTSSSMATKASKSDLLSLSELKKLTLCEQIENLLCKATVLRFSELLSYLPRNVDSSKAMAYVQQCAWLVQGCWVVKSEKLYPEGFTSQYSKAKWDALRRGRDYIMLRFNHQRFLLRKDVSKVIKLSGDDIEDILKSMARRKGSRRGWELKAYDPEFIARHPDIVERYQRLWESRLHLLSKELNIPQSDLQKAAKDVSLAAEACASASPQKRHRSMSRTISDNDTDVEMEHSARSRKQSLSGERCRRDSTNGSSENWRKRSGSGSAGVSGKGKSKEKEVRQSVDGIDATEDGVKVERRRKKSGASSDKDLRQSLDDGSDTKEDGHKVVRRRKKSGASSDREAHQNLDDGSDVKLVRRRQKSGASSDKEANKSLDDGSGVKEEGLKLVRRRKKSGASSDKEARQSFDDDPEAKEDLKVERKRKKSGAAYDSTIAIDDLTESKLEAISNGMSFDSAMEIKEEPMECSAFSESALELKEKLNTFALEIMRKRYVMTITELEQLFVSHLASSPAHHVESTLVRRKLLEESILNTGAVVVGKTEKKEPVYVFVDAGDEFDKIRRAIVELFRLQYRCRLKEIKEGVKSVVNPSPTDEEISKVVKDFCVTAGSYYSIKYTAKKAR